MAIQNISEMGQIFNKYDAKSWTKSSKIDELPGIKFDINSPLQGGDKKSQTFGEVLAKSIGDVNKLQQDANTAIEKLASGKSKNLHETLLAVERADIALKQMNQIRQKVVDAYKEIMRMQI